MQSQVVSGQHPDTQAGSEGLVQKRSNQLLILGNQ